MSLTINPNLFPKSGFKFTDPTNGISFVGNTWAGVAARVVAYRKRNNLPPGNPTAEVMAQACIQNPGYCTEANGVTQAMTREVSLKTRIIQWFVDLRKRAARGQLAFVDNDTYLRRAGTCINCPYNKPLPEGCSSCRAAVKALRKEIIGDRPEYAALVMHGCELLGTDLATSVHLDETTVDHSSLPAHCWRKRTLG